MDKKNVVHWVTLLLKRLNHTLPVHVIRKILVKMSKIPCFLTTTLPALQKLIILFTNPAAYWSAGGGRLKDILVNRIQNYFGEAIWNVYLWGYIEAIFHRQYNIHTHTCFGDPPPPPPPIFTGLNSIASN